MDDSLTPEQRRKLAVMTGLHQEWHGIAAARLTVLVRAQVALGSGTLTVAQVCKALGISESTWHRWRQQNGLADLAAECVIGIDQALRDAGATDETTVADVKTNPDLELAAGKTGVWAR